jgi:hypothetical protein
MEKYLSIQKKFRDTPVNIPGNPYALLNNGLVTEVVYMQDYSSKQIEETLNKYAYDRYEVCSEYGREIYVGERCVGDMFVTQKPFLSWIIHPSTGLWTSPVPYPTDGKEYVWNEEGVSWDFCAPCAHETNKQDVGLQEENITDAN